MPAGAVALPGVSPSTALPRRSTPLAVLLTAALWVLMFPAFSVAEAAYLFAVPLLLWAGQAGVGPRRVFLTSWLAGTLAWIALLVWLRHAGGFAGVGAQVAVFFGGLVLSAVLALFFALWMLVAKVFFLRGQMQAARRFLAALGLAGLWVVLEWLRSWVFSGFPWLPLAASQWERPALLALAPWAGSWAVSFVLIFFNLALVVWLRGLLRPARPALGWGFFRPPAELVLAVALVLFSASLFYSRLPENEEPLLTVTLVQPKVGEEGLNWSREDLMAALAAFEETTAAALAGAGKPDLILWPESVLPLSLFGRQNGLREWMSARSADFGLPVLTGAMAVEDDLVANIVTRVDPATGPRAEGFYTKQKLVPFGEFVPFHDYLPFIQRLAPIPGQSARGSGPVIFAFEGASGEPVQVAPLICYEDIFAPLARAAVRAGADVLTVHTNNTWFGEEAGAYQHAAHSVLRAAELQTPVVRCGNSGWSGWIDEYGRIRHVLHDAEGSIYFRGAETVPMMRASNPGAGLGLYARWGDWFVAVCAVLFALAVVATRLARGRSSSL